MLPASQTSLDHIYSTEISRIVASGILEYGPSDHLPVFAVRQHLIKPKRSHTVIQYRDYKRLNENSFREDLQQVTLNENFLRSDDCKRELRKMVFTFQFRGKQESSLAPKRVKRSRQPPWFSQQLLDAIKHRNKLLKKTRRTKSDEEWRLYKISRNTTSYKIRSAKANFPRTSIEDNENNP